MFGYQLATPESSIVVVTTLELMTVLDGLVSQTTIKIRGTKLTNLE